MKDAILKEASELIVEMSNIDPIDCEICVIVNDGPCAFHVGASMGAQLVQNHTIDFLEKLG